MIQSLLETDSASTLDLTKIPRHIAFINDGNRRWAKLKGLSYKIGHYKGAEVVDRIVEGAADLGVEIVTLYGFSTENWNRSKEEIDSLMYLFGAYLKKKKKTMLASGVRLKVIGDVTGLPLFLQKELTSSIEMTKNCKRIQLVLALNYGGRDELVRAFRKILDDVEKKKIDKQQVTENLISSYLDTAEMGDPELLIRTSGESRLSNYLLWQSAYTEMVSVPIFWPDFTKKNLIEAIIQYQQRKRRFGV